MTDSELHLFFENFVRTLHSRGVVCAITRGLACVHYGVAETTKDCDLLCHPGSFDVLLNLLADTEITGHACHYRGHISPPLDARWHRGGWASHFQWGSMPEVTTLDVFGHALRESSPWQDDVAGLYASGNVVAEMKRTDRDKDWPYVLAMGRENISGICGFQEEHAVRLACAEKTLEISPVSRYGIERMIEDARKSTAAFVNPELIRWLPDVRPHFRFLAS